MAEGNPGVLDPQTGRPRRSVFRQFFHRFPGQWPGVVEKKTLEGKTEKRIEPVTEDTNIQANFFDMWLRDNPEWSWSKCRATWLWLPARDWIPHITLQNARYQLDRVVEAWAKETGADPAEVRMAIENLLKQKAVAPFGGLTGVELINVLEVNLALPEVMKGITKKTGGNGGPA